MFGRLVRQLGMEGISARLIGAALAVLLSGIGPVPGVLLATVGQARLALDQGDYLSAARLYHQAYELQPWATEHLAAAAQAEMLGGHHQDAERDLRQLAEQRPLQPQEIAWLGTIYAEQGRIDEAIAAWEKARQQGLADPELLTQLAELYLARHEWEQAATVLESLLALSPANPDLLYRLGLLQALDAPQEAAQTLAQAAALDPTRADHLLPLQTSLAERNSQPPDFAYARLGLAYLGLGELELAEAALERAVAYNPAYGEALAYLAYTRSQLGKPELGAIHQALALSPNSPTVHYLAGLIWKQRSRFLEARLAFEQARTLDPANPAFAVEIADTYRAVNDHAQAEQWMLQAVQLAPDDKRFQILLAQFYVDEEYRVEEVGLPLAEALLARYPEDAEVHDVLGWAYFLLGRLDDAQDRLERALLLDPSLARAHFHLGILFEVRGQPQEAISHYTRAAELDPRGAFGAMARRALERIGSSTP